MKKPVLLIFTNAMIVIVIFLLLAQSLFLVQRGAQVASLKGQISVQKRGETEFTPLQKGEVVGIGDTVLTKNDGNATFAFADKTRWKAAPNSRLTIRKASVDALKKDEISQIRLDEGQMFIRMVKPLTANSRFEIETPNALIKVTGTVLSVKTHCDRTEVEVLKGNAQVKVGSGKAVQISAGQQGITQAGRVQVKSSDCVQLAAQSDLIKPILELGLALGEDEKSVNVTGMTEAGNQVSINEQDVELRPNGAFVQEFPLKNGHNEFSVRASDKHGVVSMGCRGVDYDVKANKIDESNCR